MISAAAHSALTDGRTAIGRGARQKLLGVACPDHLYRPVAHGLGERRIERNQFRMELKRVAIECGEQGRVGQVEVGLVERDLSGVDRPCDHHAALDDLLPGSGADRLVLPQRREGHRRRSTDQTTIDVPTEAAVEHREAELSTVRAVGAEIEPGGPQPRGHHVLTAMAGLEDPKSGRFEVAALVLRHGEVVVLDLAETLATEAGAADIASWRLGLVARHERAVKSPCRWRLRCQAGGAAPRTGSRSCG